MATIVAGIVAVLAYCSPPNTTTIGGASTPGVLMTENPPQGGPQPSPASMTGPASATSCWTAAEKLTECASAHRFESADQLSICTTSAAVEALGGDVRIDVSTVSARPDFDGHACVIDAGTEVRSFIGALKPRQGSALRRCVDGEPGDVERFVSVRCDQTHIGEYVAAAGAALTETTCHPAVTSYLGWDVNKLGSQVVVYGLSNVSESQPGPRCLITIKAGSKLNSTLRGLGNQALPRER